MRSAAVHAWILLALIAVLSGLLNTIAPQGAVGSLARVEPPRLAWSKQFEVDGFRLNRDAFDKKAARALLTGDRHEIRAQDVGKTRLVYWEDCLLMIRGTCVSQNGRALVRLGQSVAHAQRVLGRGEEMGGALTYWRK